MKAVWTDLRQAGGAVCRPSAGAILPVSGDGNQMIVPGDIHCRRFDHCIA